MTIFFFIFNFFLKKNFNNSKIDRCWKLSESNEVIFQKFLIGYQSVDMFFKSLEYIFESISSQNTEGILVWKGEINNLQRYQTRIQNTCVLHSYNRVLMLLNEKKNKNGIKRMDSSQNNGIEMNFQVLIKISGMNWKDVLRGRGENHWKCQLKLLKIINSTQHQTSTKKN